MTSENKKYPWDLLPKLASEIACYQNVQAHKDLDLPLDVFWKQSKGKIPLCKLRCAPVTSFCTRTLLQSGMPCEVILLHQLELLDNLASMRSWRQVRQLMHGYIDELLTRMRPVQGSGIRKTIADIRRTFASSACSPTGA